MKLAEYREQLQHDPSANAPPNGSSTRPETRNLLLKPSNTKHLKPSDQAVTVRGPRELTP
jgi:hypothetical protein